MRRACRDFQQSGQGSAFEFGEAAERPLERYDVQVNIPSHISCALQLGMHIIPLKVLYTHTFWKMILSAVYSGVRLEDTYSMFSSNCMQNQCDRRMLEASMGPFSLQGDLLTNWSHPLAVIFAKAS